MQEEKQFSATSGQTGDPCAPARPRRRLPTWPYALIGASALVIVVLLIMVYLRLSGPRRQLRAVEKNAADNGFALSAKELLAKYPNVPDEANAALVYVKALAKLREIGLRPQGDWVPLLVGQARSETTDEKRKQALKEARDLAAHPGQAVPEYMLEEIRAFLAARHEPLALIHSAYDRPQSRYPVNPEHPLWKGPSESFTVWSEQPALWHAAHVMELEAWLAAEEGRPYDAALSIRDALAMARRLGSEPCMTVHYSKMFLYSVTTRGLQRVVSRVALSNKDLEILQEEARKCAAEITYRRALEGDLVVYLEFYRAARRGDVSLTDFTRPSWYLDNLQLPRQGPPVTLDRLPFWSVSWFVTRDMAVTTDYLVQLARDSDAPTSAFLTSPDQRLRQIQQGRYVLAKNAGQWRGAIIRGELGRAKLQAIVASLGALRFRNDTGKLPESLQQLVPKYLAEIPTDPFSGTPLRYFVSGDEFAVYSMGENGLDDNGFGPLLRPGGSGDDHGFMVSP